MIVVNKPITRVGTVDGTFEVEIDTAKGAAKFFVAGDPVPPDAFIASVLVEWFDQLTATTTTDTEH